MSASFEAGRFVLKNDAGVTIFDSNKPIQTELGRFSGVLSLPARLPASVQDTVHAVEHDIGPAPVGLEHISGWAMLGESADLIPANRVFQFGGSVLMYATGYAFGSFLDNTAAQYWVSKRKISPTVSGGRIIIREEWFNHGQRAPGQAVRTLSAHTLTYDLRLSAFLGGV